MKTKLPRLSAIALALLLMGAAIADTPADPLTAARASDPVALGWMVGTPPPPDKIIRSDDGSHYTFPKWRWSFSHWREFRPTIDVPRGTSPVWRLPEAKRSDLDAVTFTPIGAKTPMTWADSLIANYTDGIVVLHRGRIVYERYLGALDANRPHIAFSVTKSFFGTLAAMLIAEGKLDPAAQVAKYIPELANSGFGDATVAQVLDMTSAIDFVENYTGNSPSMLAYRDASGFLMRRPGSTAPTSIYAYLATVPKGGTHGEVFEYRTPNVDVVGWLIARVTGESLADVFSERIWRRIGAEENAFLQVDPTGVPLVGSALNARLRDMARFGELMRLGGRLNGQQVIPTAVVDDIRSGASREAFARPAHYPTLPGWSYHNLWWVSHDDHGVYMARGIYGQAIYIDPKAEMVIARFASHPLAGNVNIDPTSLPAYRAIADRLMSR